MNWYNHKKNERHSFMIPNEHRDILLKPWRSMTIILGVEVRRMVSVVLLFKFSQFPWMRMQYVLSLIKLIFLIAGGVYGVLSLSWKAQRGLVIFEWRKAKEICLSLCLKNKRMTAWKHKGLPTLPVDTSRSKAKAIWIYTDYMFARGHSGMGFVLKTRWPILLLNAFINKSSPLLP